MTSGFLFAAFVLSAVACWTVLARTHDSGAAAGRLVVLYILATIPFLLFSTIMIETFVGAPAGEYRVALEAVEFDLGGGAAVTIGGGADGADADDVIVRDLPPGYLTLSAEGEQVIVRLPAELDHAIDNPEYAAVRVDGARPFLNSVSLAGAQRVTILSSDQAQVVLDVNARSLSVDGAVRSTVPTRMQPIGAGWEIPIGRNLPAETVMYPLRFGARAPGSNDILTGRDGAALGSFLSWDGSIGGPGGYRRQNLYVTLVGDDASVRFDDGRVARYERQVATIPANGQRHLDLYRLDYVDPLSGDEGRSRAQERRSFRVAYRQQRLAIVFETPYYIRLSAGSIARLKHGDDDSSGFLLSTRDPVRQAPIVANQMSLFFPQLGRRVQNELYSAIRVSDEPTCAVRVTWHSGVRCHALGDAFRIGDRAAAVVRLTRISIPWGIIATLVVVAVLSAVWMSLHRHDTTAIILISAAEVMLAVRLLIAFEGALLDPASASALWESLAIFVFLPMALRGGWAGRTPGTWRPLGWVALLSVPATLLVAAALWRAHVAIKAIAATSSLLMVAPLLIGLLAPPGVTWLNRRLHSPTAILVFAALLIGVRVLIMMALGWKERISFGFDLAVTALYLPALCFFFAALWERLRRAEDGPPARASGASVWLALLYGLIGVVLLVGVPFLVKDSGSALVYTPAVALFFTLPFVAQRTGRTAALAVPLLAIIFVHLVVAAMPYLRGRTGSDPSGQADYRAALTSQTAAVQYVEQRVQQSANQLRIMSSVAPHQLEAAGTSKAEGLVMQRRLLDRYGGRGVWGAGYLEVPLSFFLDTHLNDNLSALHVLAPFGAAGALAIMVLLVAVALLPIYVLLVGRPDALAATPQAAIDSLGALGVLALWTFAIAGFYMFAANLGLVLFTGKNVYLLAGSSNSDAIEGGLLLLLGLLALGRARPVPAN